MGPPPWSGLGFRPRRSINTAPWRARFRVTSAVPGRPKHSIRRACMCSPSPRTTSTMTLPEVLINERRPRAPATRGVHETALVPSLRKVKQWLRITRDGGGIPRRASIPPMVWEYNSPPILLARRKASQAGVWAASVVRATHSLRIPGRCLSWSGIRKSKHSRRRGFDEVFAESVGLRCSEGRLQDALRFSWTRMTNEYRSKDAVTQLQSDLQITAPFNGEAGAVASVMKI